MNALSYWHDGQPLNVNKLSNEGHLEYWHNGQPFNVYDSNEFVYNGSISLSLTPNSSYHADYVYQGNITINITPSHEILVDFAYYGQININLGTRTLYGDDNDFLYDANIPVSIAPTGSYYTANEFHYEGEINIKLTPEASTVGSWGYVGEIPLKLEPTSQYHTPIPGRDPYTGYGLADLTFLTETPPYICLTGDITVTIDPTAELASQFTEYPVTATGGLEFGGEGEKAFTTPTVYEVTASGGFEVKATTVYEFVTPTVYEKTGIVKIKVNGESDIDFVRPPLLPFELIASGGLSFSSATDITFQLPSVEEIIAEGGFVFSSNTRKQFITPRDLIYSVIASGGITVSGGEYYSFITPGELTYFLTSKGGLELSSNSIISFVYPVIVSIIASGGLELGGENIEDIYQTWVLSGTNFNPSIYSNYNFNSYCQHQGKYYAANKDGIYVLEGTSDNGEEIHTGIELISTHLGTNNQKRLRTVTVNEGDATIKVKIDSNEYEGNTTKGKLFIPRALQGKEVKVIIKDFSKLDFVEIEPVILGY